MVEKGFVGSIFLSNLDFHPIDTEYFIKYEQISYYLYYTLINTHYINTDVAFPGFQRKLAYKVKLLWQEYNFQKLFNEIGMPLQEQI